MQRTVINEERKEIYACVRSGCTYALDFEKVVDALGDDSEATTVQDSIGEILMDNSTIVQRYSKGFRNSLATKIANMKPEAFAMYAGLICGMGDFFEMEEP